jgi:hypothetical protein
MYDLSTNRARAPALHITGNELLTVARIAIVTNYALPETISPSPSGVLTLLVAALT